MDQQPNLSFLARITFASMLCAGLGAFSAVGHAQTSEEIEGSPKSIRFAQITDVHLFDAGYKCSGKFVEMERRENLKALRWSIAEIVKQQRKNPVDFVVFTGDLGLSNLSDVNTSRPKPSDPMCAEPSASADTYGPVAPVSLDEAEKILASILRDLPQNVPVYFVPGNNDLVSSDPKLRNDIGSNSEDPDSVDRYKTFLAGVQQEMPNWTIRNLDKEQAGKNGEYTLIGFNSAGFKPQFYQDGKGDTVNEAGQVDKEKQPSVANPPLPYCQDLDDSSSKNRANQKKATIDWVTQAVAGDGTFLLFTHEPDLQDPFRNINHDSDTNRDICEYRSTWLLTKQARKDWQDKVLSNRRVLGVFAGHFHSGDFSNYGRANFNDAERMLYAPAGSWTAPTYVTMPLAIKLQWKSLPFAARGMTFYTLRNNVVVPQIEIYKTELDWGCCGERDDWFALVRRWLRMHPGSAFWIAGAVTFLLYTVMVLLVPGIYSYAQFLNETVKDRGRLRRAQARISVRDSFPIMQIVLNGEHLKREFDVWIKSNVTGTNRKDATANPQQKPDENVDEQAADQAFQHATAFLLSKIRDDTKVLKLVEKGVGSTWVSRLFLGGIDRALYILSLSERLLLEPDTNTYSLSKLQFLLWSLATIYAYTYLTIAHIWVQGIATIPELSTQFPWEFSVSALTAVFSRGTTRLVGNKGSGPLGPRLSDLISAGGVVAPGRLQFFSWTVVAIVTYLVSVIATDPLTVNVLPAIPRELLDLSGLSALAYLGSKWVSAPGPVLSAVEFHQKDSFRAEPGESSPESLARDKLVMVGTGLSKLGLVTLYEFSIAPPDVKEPAPVLSASAKADPPPLLTQPGSAIPGKDGFFTRLEVGVAGVQMGTSYRLRIQNPDGRYAEVDFTRS